MVFHSSQQMEQYFAMISETMEGYGDFEVEALAFKVRICHIPQTTAHMLTRLLLQHERLNIERRLAGTPQEDGASAPGGSVNTTDVARLMEMFQVSPPVLSTDLYVYRSVPRVPSSSTGTSNPLMMRINTLT
jgi:hypothetical protein